MIQHKELFFIGQTSLAKIMKGIYDLSHVLQFLLEYLCTLSEKDFDAILIDYQDGDNPPEPTLSSEYKKFTKQIGHDIKLSPMEDGKQEEVVKWMKLFIFYKLNTTIIGNREMPLLGKKHALALSKAQKIQFVIIDNKCTGLESYWDIDSPFFQNIKDFQKLCLVKPPKDVKICFLL